MGGPVKVAKLNEEQAIEQGAEILGETVIFGIAAICLILDYMRSARKEAAKEVAAQERLKKMENGIFEIGMLSERQDAQIRELTRALMALKPKGVNLKEYEAMHVDIKFEPQPDPAAHSVEPDIDHHKWIWRSPGMRRSLFFLLLTVSTLQKSILLEKFAVSVC